MKIGINQFCYPMTYDVKEAIETSKKLGYTSFEVCFTAADESKASKGIADSLDISRYHNRLLNTKSTEQDLLELRKIAEGSEISIDSIGGIISFSIYPLTSKDYNIANKSEYFLKKMIHAAQVLGASTVLIIPGMITQDLDYEDSFYRVQERIGKLADYAPDITLAIENVWNNFLYSPMELNQFVDGISKKNVGIYFDIANARRYGYPEQWIKTMNSRIKKIHLKDYRMSVDNINGFTNLLEGDVDYPAVAKSLLEINYNGDAIVELIPPATYHVEETLKYARKIAEKLFKLKYGGI